MERLQPFTKPSGAWDSAQLHEAQWLTEMVKSFLAANAGLIVKRFTDKPMLMSYS